MVKYVAKLLQIPIKNIIFCALFIKAGYQLFKSYGYYEYTSTCTRYDAHRALHEEVNLNLKPDLDPFIPECSYDFLDELDSWIPQEMPKEFVNFSVPGIVNGSYYPKDCRPVFSVALLVTFRNRQKQLDLFIPYMHIFLMSQNIHYKIYVIEQQEGGAWNKGVLYNVGARRAIADGFPCLVLHDVDLLPLDRANMYACLRAPRHMSASIDKFRYVLPYKELVGGVVSLLAPQYVQVNGFSNRYLGWGGEDDDFSYRLNEEKLDLLRLPRVMSRYTMLSHRQEPRNPLRGEVLAAGRWRHRDDGYTTLYSAHRSARLKTYVLYTMITVYI